MSIEPVALESNATPNQSKSYVSQALIAPALTALASGASLYFKIPKPVTYAIATAGTLVSLIVFLRPFRLSQVSDKDQSTTTQPLSFRTKIVSTALVALATLASFYFNIPTPVTYTLGAFSLLLVALTIVSCLPKSQQSSIDDASSSDEESFPPATRQQAEQKPASQAIVDETETPVILRPEATQVATRQTAPPVDTSKGGYCTIS
jgi:hypothetical protein